MNKYCSHCGKPLRTYTTKSVPDFGTTRLESYGFLGLKLRRVSTSPCSLELRCMNCDSIVGKVKLAPILEYEEV